MATKEDLQNELKGLETELRGEMQDIRKDIRKTEHRIMDAMDDKLADLKGDLIVLMRKMNKKLGALVYTLKNKRIITRKESGEILEMQPFPQIK